MPWKTVQRDRELSKRLQEQQKINVCDFVSYARELDCIALCVVRDYEAVDECCVAQIRSRKQ